MHNPYGLEASASEKSGGAETPPEFPAARSHFSERVRRCTHINRCAPRVKRRVRRLTLGDTSDNRGIGIRFSVLLKRKPRLSCLKHSLDLFPA